MRRDDPVDCGRGRTACRPGRATEGWGGARRGRPAPGRLRLCILLAACATGAAVNQAGMPRAAAAPTPVAATTTPAPAAAVPAPGPGSAGDAAGGAAPEGGAVAASAHARPAAAAGSSPAAVSTAGGTGTAPGSATPAGGAAEAAPAAAGSANPSIRKILVGSATDLGVAPEQAPARLGEWLTLEISGLDALVAKAQAQKKPLVLYLNGMPLGGVPPVFLYSQGRIADVRFALRRTDDSKDTWAALLGKPRAEQRDVEISVGLAGCAEGCADITDPATLPFEVVRPAWLIGFILGMVAGVWLLFQLARRTPLLRDGNMSSPWSLGRIQMAWWSLFVVASFVFIWMVTGSYGSLTNSVLALIGMSSATGLASAVIDDNKKAQVRKVQALEVAASQPAAAPAAAPAAGSGAAAARPAEPPTPPPTAVEIAAQLAQLPAIKNAQGLLLDILSDENGVSFHRLQVVIWTLVMTLIFVVNVYTHLDMPDFDTQLLALMGISNGTYIGFKLPEKQVAMSA